MKHITGRISAGAALVFTASLGVAQKVDRPKDMILFPAGKNLPAIVLLGGSYGLIQSREPLSRKAEGIAMDYLGAPARSPFVPAKRTADGETITVRSTYDTPMAFRIESKGSLLALASRTDAPILSFQRPLLEGDALPIPNAWIDAIYDVDRDCLIRFSGELIGFERDSKGLRVFARNQVAVTRFQFWRRDHLGLFAFDPKHSADDKDRKPVVGGWTSSGIDAKELTEEDLLNAAGFLKDRFSNYGMERIRLEGGHLKHEAPGTVALESSETWPSRMVETNERFPSGLSALSKQLRNLGAVPEIAGEPYAPLKLLPLEQLIEEKAGEPLTVAEFGTLPDPKSKVAFATAFLTPRDALAKAGWEFAGWNSLTPWTYGAYRLAPPDFWKRRKLESDAAVREAINNLSKEETVLGGILPELVGVAKTMRVEPGAIKDAQTQQAGMGNGARFHAFHGHLWQTEFAPIDLNLPTPSFRSTVAFASLLGHKIMLTGRIDPTNNFEGVSPENVDFLKKCLPVPSDQFGGNVGELAFSGYLLHPFQVQNDKLTNGRPGLEHGAQFTRIAQKAGGAVDLLPATLGLLLNKTYLVYDAVSGELIGPVNAQTAITLPAVAEGDVQSVCFVPAQNRPHVLGSNRHLLQMGHAVRNEKWEVGALEFEALISPDKSVSILVAVPESVAPEPQPGLVFDEKTRIATLVLPPVKSVSNLFTGVKIVFRAVN